MLAHSPRQPIISRSRCVRNSCKWSWLSLGGSSLKPSEANLWQLGGSAQAKLTSKRIVAEPGAIVPWLGRLDGNISSGTKHDWGSQSDIKSRKNCRTITSAPSVVCEMQLSNISMKVSYWWEIIRATGMLGILNSILLRRRGMIPRFQI